ncbi:Hypothetical predicted protein, partial [Marmota monax]
MFQDFRDSNSSQFQVSEFILMGFPGIHSWQHWLSLPPALLYLLALEANIQIMTIIYQESVLKLNSKEAASKALNTCTSHLILILFFYTVIVVISITHSGGMKLPLIPVLLNVLHNVIPPALNPMVYALKNKEL